MLRIVIILAEAGWKRKECVIFRRLEVVNPDGHKKKIIALRKAIHVVVIQLVTRVWLGVVARGAIIEQMLVENLVDILCVPAGEQLGWSATPPKPKSAA